MPDLFMFLRRMFSGFKSQWITFCCLEYLNPCSIWMANLLISPRETPWKSFDFMNSYRFMLSSSNVMQMCFRNMKLSFNLIILFSSFGSFSRKCLKILTSTLAWYWNFFLFRIILRAMKFLRLWSNHLMAWPKLPLPRKSIISNL